jgi:hypothetical protein
VIGSSVRFVALCSLDRDATGDHSGRSTRGRPRTTITADGLRRIGRARPSISADDVEATHDEPGGHPDPGVPRATTCGSVGAPR